VTLVETTAAQIAPWRLTVEIRALHTTTVRVLVRPRGGHALRVVNLVQPARRGDGHLAQAEETLCGQDASGWKTVTGTTWLRLGEYRCPDCQKEAVSLNLSALPGRMPAGGRLNGQVIRRLS
jgi:hypothetical protein